MTETASLRPAPAPRRVSEFKGDSGGIGPAPEVIRHEHAGTGHDVRRREMLTIDVQVHAYERNHPGRPWVGTLTGPAEGTGDQMVAAMGAVGVDGAILVSPFSMYRFPPYLGPM